MTLVYRGMGDIIRCPDESGSTEGKAAAWGKAVALTLLDIAEDGGRSFALIRYARLQNLQSGQRLVSYHTNSIERAYRECQDRRFA